jgi:hypothetical protein
MRSTVPDAAGLMRPWQARTMSRAPCASGFAGSGNATSLRKSRPRVFGQHAVLLIAGGPGLVVAQTSFGPPANADTTPQASQVCLTLHQVTAVFSRTVLGAGDPGLFRCRRHDAG